MKYAVTDYDGCEYITAGKRYEVTDYDGVYFDCIDDHGDRICTSVENSNHLNGNDWRIEMNSDIEQQGNDFEVKYDDKAKEDVVWIDEATGYFHLDDGGQPKHAIKYIRADLALQKQPEMSKLDVTRSDIELIDYFAGQALQGILSNPDIMRGVLGGRTKDPRPMPEKVSDMACNIATAMMEARK